MTDTYRTAVNPYTAKAEEARTKLQRERTAATELEAQRVALLAEVNAGLAPFRVYRRQGGTFEFNTVRLTHPSSSLDLGICYEDTMLEDLPRRVGTAAFATAIESIEADIKKRTARTAAIRRFAEPVAVSIGGTLLSCMVFGFELGRIAFVLTGTLTFNLWYFGTFKRSPP